MQVTIAKYSRIVLIVALLCALIGPFQHYLFRPNQDRHRKFFGPAAFTPDGQLLGAVVSCFHNRDRFPHDTVFLLCHSYTGKVLQQIPIDPACFIAVNRELDHWMLLVLGEDNNYIIVNGSENTTKANRNFGISSITQGRFGVELPSTSEMMELLRLRSHHTISGVICVARGGNSFFRFLNLYAELLPPNVATKTGTTGQKRIACSLARTATLLESTEENALRVYDSTGHCQTLQTPGLDCVSGIAVSNDEKIVVVAGTTCRDGQLSGRIILYDSGSWTPLHSMDTERPIISVGFCSESRPVQIVDTAGVMSLYDVNGTCLKQVSFQFGH